MVRQMRAHAGTVYPRRTREQPSKRGAWPVEVDEHESPGLHILGTSPNWLVYSLACGRVDSRVCWAHGTWHMAGAQTVATGFRSSDILDTMDHVRR